MLHARPDYAHIQDPTGKIPADEPVFLLRGQDVAAPMTVMFWSALAAKTGAGADIRDAAVAQATRMLEWQKTHFAKVPDGPKPPAPDLGALSEEEALMVREFRKARAQGITPVLMAIG